MWQSFYYTLIAAVIFLLPQISSLPTKVILQITAVVLFAFGSLSRVVTSLPLIMKSDLAMDKLLNLEKRLDEAGEKPAAPVVMRHDFKQIELKDILFRYNENDPRAFELGPLDFDLNRGEVVFVSGGNGSGKTTLLKVLAGLYKPLQGRIQLDGQLVEAEALFSHRELFSAIFKKLSCI